MVAPMGDAGIPPPPPTHSTNTFQSEKMNGWKMRKKRKLKKKVKKELWRKEGKRK